jgi:hypothetical protein
MFPELPLIPDDDPDSFVSLAESARGVLLAMASATMRRSNELGAEHAPDRTRAGE